MNKKKWQIIILIILGLLAAAGLCYSISKGKDWYELINWTLVGMLLGAIYRNNSQK